MKTPPGPLLDALRDPAGVAELTEAEWDVLWRQARREKLQARLALDVAECGLIDRLPEPVRNHIHAQRNVAAAHARGIRWEVDRIEHALRGVDTKVALLKGAAYLMSGMPMARGRLSADVDILVAKRDLGFVEAALLEHGWEAVKLDDYDQEYYRRWMHELPPLRHRDRHALIDVHHTILPETSRLHPDPDLLLADAPPLAPGRRMHVLAPADMVLHSSAHLFYDGDFDGGVRDALDLDNLLRRFGGEAAFWKALGERALQLDLLRPLFYMLHFVPRLFGTPVPETVRDAAAGGRPGRMTLVIMDRLVGAALSSVHPDRPAGGVQRWLLYLRSHWLRMPPLLLARHLLIKACKRLTKREQPSERIDAEQRAAGRADPA